MQTSNLITSSVRRGAAERVIGFATAVPSVVLPSALSIERRDESGNIEPRIGTVERVEITVAPDGIRGDLGVLEQIEQHGLERVELRAGRHPGLAHDLDARPPLVRVDHDPTVNFRPAPSIVVECAVHAHEGLNLSVLLADLAPSRMPGAVEDRAELVKVAILPDEQGVGRLPRRGSCGALRQGTSVTHYVRTMHHA